MKRIAEKHVESLEQKVDEINMMLKTLKHLTKNCHGDNRPNCPILSNLSGEQDKGL